MEKFDFFTFSRDNNAMSSIKQKRIELPKLPYSYDTLEPVISKTIISLHHSRHHLAYVTGANAAIDKLEKARAGEGPDLDIKSTLRDLSFNLSGVKLHNIFWSNMRKPKKSNEPSGKVLELINENFGSYEVFQKEFSDAAKAVEASGWASLVLDEETGDLHVLQLQNHNLLFVAGCRPLLVLDVWEHAYYLDYQNNRGEYVDAWWQVVNWDDVNKRLE